jgi:microcystin degradation protein MlrC
MNVLIAGFQHETNTPEARAPGPMSADPSDLPWTRLAASARVPD